MEQPHKSDSAFIRHCLQTVGVGVAVADADTWAILFENAKFFSWFPPGADADEPLNARLTGLDVDRARSRLKDGRPYTFEADVKVGARSISLNVQLRRDAVDGRQYLIVECHNTSKQKEAEYMLDSYSRLAEKRARDLEKAKERVERLLLNIMPRSVYEEMKDLGTATPQRFESASVLMLDFVGFTTMAVSRDPSALIAELNDIFSAFDRIVDMYGCERIKTIGDAYLAVSGLPEANADHAANVAKVALRMRRYLNRRNASHPNQWSCRIGLATGAVIGSLVGIHKYVYDIFGPAVNLASRLETLCEPMQILLGESTREAMGDEFVLTARDEAEVRGFGPMQLYSLEGELEPHGGPARFASSR